MYMCDLCDTLKASVKKQLNDKGECIFQMCTRCGNAVVKQAEVFEREQKLKIEAARNG